MSTKLEGHFRLSWFSLNGRTSLWTDQRSSRHSQISPTRRVQGDFGMETHLRHAQSLKTIPPPCCHCLCISDSRQCSPLRAFCRFSVSEWQEQDPRLRFQANKAAPQYLSSFLFFRPIVRTSLRHTPRLSPGFLSPGFCLSTIGKLPPSPRNSFEGAVTTAMC
jgi:hypothetical protein